MHKVRQQAFLTLHIHQLVATASCVAVVLFILRLAQDRGPTEAQDHPPAASLNIFFPSGSQQHPQAGKDTEAFPKVPESEREANGDVAGVTLSQMRAEKALLFQTKQMSQARTPPFKAATVLYPLSKSRS